jgi:hypothetical protein
MIPSWIVYIPIILILLGVLFFDTKYNFIAYILACSGLIMMFVLVKIIKYKERNK